MPRRPDVDPPVELGLMLPTSVRAKLDLHLFSELEGRVPKGAYRSFFLERIAEFFMHKTLDLGAYGFPQGFTVRGMPAVIDELEERLKRG